MLNRSPCNKDVSANGEKLHTFLKSAVERNEWSPSPPRKASRPIGLQGRSEDCGEKKNPSSLRTDPQFFSRSTRTLVTILSYTGPWSHVFKTEILADHRKCSLYRPTKLPPELTLTQIQEWRRLRLQVNYNLHINKINFHRLLLATSYPATVTYSNQLAKANSALNIPTSIKFHPS